MRTVSRSYLVKSDKLPNSTQQLDGEVLHKTLVMVGRCPKLVQENAFRDLIKNREIRSRQWSKVLSTSQRHVDWLILTADGC